MPLSARCRWFRHQQVGRSTGRVPAFYFFGDALSRRFGHVAVDDSPFPILHDAGSANAITARLHDENGVFIYRHHVGCGGIVGLPEDEVARICWRLAHVWIVSRGRRSRAAWEKASKQVHQKPIPNGQTGRNAKRDTLRRC
jgi:hypothetical protein